MKILRRRKTQIAVIGGIHIDVLADYKISEQGKIDKIGELNYSIGGTAYNIAHFLHNDNVPVDFFSVLNQNSFSTSWIKREIRHTRINYFFQYESKEYFENGFIAIRKEGELENAVTSSFLSKVQLDISLIKKIIKGKKIVALDCNFASRQLIDIFEICKRENVLTVISSTSDSKVNRIKVIAKSYNIDFVIMNEKEARVFFQKDIKFIKASEIPPSIKNLIITCGEKGYFVYSQNEKARYPAPHITEIESTSAAGDALVAAIVRTLKSNTAFSWNICSKYINKYVSEALSQRCTYIKPTRKKKSYKALFIWLFVFLIILLTLATFVSSENSDITILFAIISIILAIGQIIRSELMSED